MNLFKARKWKYFLTNLDDGMYTLQFECFEDMRSLKQSAYSLNAMRMMPCVFSVSTDNKNLVATISVKPREGGMSDNDMEVLSEARKAPFSKIFDLLPRCDSEEARNILFTIAKRTYRRERENE